jgi:formylglycine-generating enzyme required for sulfatase activity
MTITPVETRRLPSNPIDLRTINQSVSQPANQPVKMHRKMNTHNATQKSALLLAVLLITAGAATAIAATPGSIIIDMEIVKITGGNNPDGPDYGHEHAYQIGYGAVSYDYYIGTKEVTNAQYTAFLNAVASQSDTYALYNPAMASYGITRAAGGEGGYTYTTTSPDKPVVYVTFWNAARFCNWLTSGETETGVYDFTAAGSPVNPTNDTINRDADAWAAGGWALPTEDEWYKAAYYNPKTNSYSVYPTGSDTITADDANYNTGSLTDAGHYTANQNGIFDMAGNVWEWNETIGEDDSFGRRGGSFRQGSYLASSARSTAAASSGLDVLGFRVVFSSLTSVPEPGTWAAATGLATLVVGIWLRHIRLRRARRG